MPSVRPSHLQQLLDATAGARRDLDAQVADAERAIAEREIDQATATGRPRSHRGRAQRGSGVVEATAAVARTDAAMRVLVAAEAAAREAVRLRTTVVGYPRAPGHSASDEANPVHLAAMHAVLSRQRAAVALDGAQTGLKAIEERANAARRTVANGAEELDGRRNALNGLRQRLEAAIASGTARVPWAAHALTAERGVAQPSPLAATDIPGNYLELYRRHATSCPGLPWTVLAAIGSIESSHGRSTVVGVHDGANYAGAMGPMQFLGPTWAAYGIDGDGDGMRDLYRPGDAIAGASNYLCANGAGHLASLAAAIWNYNHADWYVEAVIELAAAYGGGMLAPPTAPTDRARLVENPNITLTAQARSDILSGLADDRVVAFLAATAVNHRITVSVIKSGHDKYVRGTDRVSKHYGCHRAGRAVDITAVDGVAVGASNVAALEFALLVLTSDSSLGPDEFGSPWPELVRWPGGFSDDGHQNHLHLGWP